MNSNPWFRKHDEWWYFYSREGGKRRQVKLVPGKDNRQAAYDRWHELCRPRAAAQGFPLSTESVVGLLDVFLDWCQKNRPPRAGIFNRRQQATRWTKHGDVWMKPCAGAIGGCLKTQVVAGSTIIDACAATEPFLWLAP